MIEQVNVTNLNRPYAAAHNAYIVNMNDTIYCNTITLLGDNEECTYVKDTGACHELDANIDYSKQLYCTCNVKEYRQACILLLILLAIIYILVIISTTYTSLAPNVIAITEHMNLTEFGGAIFAIAFSCCLTGVLEVLDRFQNDTELILVEVLTTNMHLRCLCCGIFLIFSPLVIHPIYYSRDQIFYITGSLITFSFMSSETLHLVAAICGISLFIFIIIMVFVQENCVNLEESKEYIHELHYKLRTKYVVINPFEQSKLRINTPQTLFHQFFSSIEPRKLQLAYRSNYWQKIIIIIALPVNIFIALCIPVYNIQLPLNGWSKLLNLLNLFIFPIGFCLCYHHMPLTAIITYFVAAFLLAIYVIFKSTANEPPAKFHIIFAYLGNFFCIGLIFIMESELMAVLTTLGYTYQLTRPFIGLHLLSSARVLATIVLAATLASWGYKRMAFRIMTFSPIVRILLQILAIYHRKYVNYIILIVTNLAMSVLVLLKCIAANAIRVSIRPGVNGYAGVVFLCIEFFTVFPAVIILNFHLRKSMGYYLLALYTIFIFIKLLSGTLFIHPYGTDHFIDLDGPDAPWA